MKPLAVLLLVLGALGALLVALLTLTNTGRSGPEPRGPEPVTPSEPAARPALLADPTPPVAQQPQAQSTEGARQALQADPDPSGRKVSFGGIEGHVKDEAKRPIQGATVSLVNAKPSPMGFDAQFELSGTEPPRPSAKVVTDEKGDFRFEQLDPRKDWMLVVTHPNFLRWEPDQAIPVPEGALWREEITLKPGQICSGVVRETKTSQPVVGALLEVESPWPARKKKSASHLETRTNENGAYQFANVGATPTQPRILTVSAPGFATQIHNNFAMAVQGEAPTRFKNVQGEGKYEGRVQDFELEPGFVIAGRLLGPDQRGVPGLEVQALSQSGTISSGGSAKSGAKGEFLIEGVAEGIYTVRVEATNFDADPQQRVEAGDTNVTIQLFERAAIAGKVVDSSGQPLSNFVVKARTANEVSKAYGAVMSQKAVKGSKDGRFELNGVPDGSYVIEGIAEGFASSFSETVTATQGLLTSDVVVRMSRGGSIKGQVLDAYGRAPVVGAEVATVDNDWIDGDLWELFGALEPSALTKTKVYTDEQGRFEIELMTPGTYQVQFRAKGFSMVFVTGVEVVEGQATELPSQAMSKGAVITGIIYGRDTMIQAGANVQLAPSDVAQLRGNRTTRADGTGRYRIENAQPGTYQLSATRANSSQGNPFEAIGDMRQSQIEISIDDGGVYEFDLRLGSVGGN